MFLTSLCFRLLFSPILKNRKPKIRSKTLSSLKMAVKNLFVFTYFTMQWKAASPSSTFVDALLKALSRTQPSTPRNSQLQLYVNRLGGRRNRSMFSTAQFHQWSDFFGFGFIKQLGEAKAVFLLKKVWWNGF